MSSRSPRSPHGLGAASGALGRYLMDHITMSGEGEGGALAGVETRTPGRCVLVSGMNGAAAFSMQIYRSSKGAASQFSAVTFGEMKPRAENHVVLDADKLDACGNPTLRIQCQYSDDDLTLAVAQSQALRDVARMLGVKLTRLAVEIPPPGTAMHECGTARMGNSPKDSVLDPHCQCWEAQGLYVTDGAAFPSQGAQHPTLTIMALTARACAHALSSGALLHGAAATAAAAPI
jgi:choline dehydrogenase-like flavoprotein